MTTPAKSYRDLIGQRQDRTFVLNTRELVIDETARTVELAFASQVGVERWFGTEILECSSRSVMLERLNAGGALLSDHSSRNQVGAVVRGTARVDADKVCRATVKFSERQAGEDEWRDVKADIRTNVSVGYIVHEYTHNKDTDTYTATRWEPLEISLVSIPADVTVGVGRSSDDLSSADHPAAEDIEKAKLLLERSGRTILEPSASPPEISVRTTQPHIEVREMADENNNKPENTSEVARATEIMDLAKVIDAPGETLAQEVARDAIAQGKTLPEFRQMVFEKRQEREGENKTPLKQGHVIDLTEREKNQFSISRAILTDSNIRLGTGDQKSFELEVSQEIEKRLDVPGYQRRGGMFIPTTVALRGFEGGKMMKRAGLDTQTNTAGQELVYTEPGAFIDLLRNRAMVLQLGATFLPGLQGNVSFPKQIGAGTFHWVGENSGVDVPESNLTLDNVLLSPKTGQSTTSFSRQLLAQSVVNVDGLVMSDIAKVNALGLDRGCLHGAGGDAPIGLYSESGVNSIAFGGPISFDKAVDMETEISSDNADIGTMAYLTTTNVRGKAKKTPELDNTIALPIWRGGEMNGYRAEATNQLSKTLGAGTEHGMIFGVWAELVIGEWGALEILTDPYALKKQGMIEVTSFMMANKALRYAEAFCKATGLTVN